MQQSASGTPIAPWLRAWLAAEVAFGVLSVASIGLFPHHARTNFAWAIQPTVMAAVLGAFYLASVWLALLATFARRWENIRVLAFPLATLTTTELIATVWHWDRFSTGTVPFWIWFVSYVVPPPVFIFGYFWHQKRAGPGSLLPDKPLPAIIRSFLMVAGPALFVLGLVTFLFPGWLIDTFPWRLTPLNARALNGWVMTLGALLLSMARENDHTRVRLATPMLVLMLPAVGLQLARFAGEVDWRRPVLWVALALLAVVAAVGLRLVSDWRTWQAAMR